MREDPQVMILCYSKLEELLHTPSFVLVLARLAAPGITPYHQSYLPGVEAEF